MGEPKAYSELTSELTWHAMSQIVDGTPLKRVISEIMDATIEWHRANRIGKKEPDSNREEYLERNLNDTRESLNHNAEALRQAKQERDTLAAALTASEADVETLKQRVKDYEGDNHRLVDENHKLKKDLDSAKQHIQEKAQEVMNAYSDVARLEKERDDAKGALRMARERAESYYAENQKLRNGQVAQAQDITRLGKESEALEHRLGEVAAERDNLKAFNAELHEENNLLRQEIAGLKQAPETIKREMNALVQEVSQQRDAEKVRGDVAVAQRDEWIEKFNKQVEDYKAVIHERNKAESEVAALKMRVVKRDDEIKALQSSIDYVKLHVHNMNQVLK